MLRVILSVIVLAAIAVLIALNAGSATAFNLFGYRFADVPVIVIAIGGFILGVLCSLLYALMRTVSRYRRSRLEGQNARLRERVRAAEAVEREATPETATPQRRTLFDRLFGGPKGDDRS